LGVRLYHRTASVNEEIDSQVQLLWNLALEQGFLVEKAYGDSGSGGANRDRPGLNQLLQDARNGEVEAILASSPARLASVPEELVRITSELTELGITIHYIDLSAPRSQLFC
jgi:DNA invertase Pin-like site-specific DNA recombinase